MSDRCRACSIGLHCGLCDCCPSKKAPDAGLDETKTVRLPRTLTGRDPLRLAMPTRAQVRSFRCPRCGARAGTPCLVTYPSFRFLSTHHKDRVEAARRSR